MSLQPSNGRGPCGYHPTLVRTISFLTLSPCKRPTLLVLAPTMSLLTSSAPRKQTHRNMCVCYAVRARRSHQASARKRWSVSLQQMGRAWCSSSLRTAGDGCPYGKGAVALAYLRVMLERPLARYSYVCSTRVSFLFELRSFLLELRALFWILFFGGGGGGGLAGNGGY